MLLAACPVLGPTGRSLCSPRRSSRAWLTSASHTTISIGNVSARWHPRPPGCHHVPGALAPRSCAEGPREQGGEWIWGCMGGGAAALPSSSQLVQLLPVSVGRWGRRGMSLSHLRKDSPLGLGPSPLPTGWFPPVSQGLPAKCASHMGLTLPPAHPSVFRNRG